MQPLIDLQIQYQSIKQEINEAIQRVLDRSDFILGAEVKEFEQAIAKYLGVRFAIGVASGTDALKIAMKALHIGAGDEVITTPFTFVATAESIHHVGARPIFADIDHKTLNINPHEIAKKISSKTKAIIPVHLYGQPADMDAIKQVIGDRKIAVIEDCAQSMGARYKGKQTGSMGAAGCFSFFPGKNLGCYGDGGLVTTNDEEIARLAVMIRNHGSVNKYENVISGYNSRLDTIQAAILLVKLKYLDRWNELRRQHAKRYRHGLTPLGYTFPADINDIQHSMNYFTFCVSTGRDNLRDYLTKNNVSTGIYYPLPLHLQKVFAYLGYAKGDFPVSESLQDTILSLPMYPELTDVQIDAMIRIINGYNSQKSKRSLSMRVLITGVTGFVGSHLAELLLAKKKIEVFGIERWRSDTSNIKHIKNKLHFIECDIRDYSNMKKVIKKIRPHKIFHLAAQSFVPTSWNSPAETINTNMIGQLNLFEAVRDAGINPWIQIACSSEEYGMVYKNEVPITEENPLRPLSPYAVSKVGQDLMGYQYYQSYGLKVVRTRGFNHTGPRRGEVFVTSNFSQQIALIESGRQKPVICVGNLDAIRDFTDVRDMVRAYWLATEGFCKPGEVYNICSGRGYKIKDMLNMLLRMSKVKITVKQEPSRMRPSDVQILLGDNTKFRKATGWKPLIPFEKTMEDLLNYWRQKVS